MIIFTDRGADLPKDYQEKHNIYSLPLSFVFEGVTYSGRGDDGEKSLEYFYEQLKAGKTSQTSQVNRQDFEEMLTPHLEKGEEILVLSLSAGISGTYDSLAIYSKELSAKYPQAKLRVFNTLLASMGQCFMVDWVLGMIEEGKKFDEICKFIETNVQHFHATFTVDDLKYLARTGRLNSTTAFIGTLLNLKPILYIDPNGKLTPKQKAKGRKNALQAMVDNMEADGFDAKLCKKVFISHADSLSDAEYFAGKICERFRIAKSDITMGLIGPIIGTHAGPGTIAVFYYGKNPRKSVD